MPILHKLLTLPEPLPAGAIGEFVGLGLAGGFELVGAGDAMLEAEGVGVVTGISSGTTAPATLSTGNFECQYGSREINKASPHVQE